jgi:hypothetical protein
VLNTAYAYLAAEADAADAVAVPAYRVAQVDQEDIEKMSNRRDLDDWLDAPYGDDALRRDKLLSYLTS